MLTCRRYYRRLFLSGGLFTMLQILYQDFLSRSNSPISFLFLKRRIYLLQRLPRPPSRACP